MTVVYPNQPQPGLIPPSRVIWFFPKVPVTSLNTADGTTFNTGTPVLEFTAVDAEGDDVTYEIEISADNTFPTGSSPDTIATLKAWWKSDSLALSDGASVSAWSDSSNNGWTASQGTGANQPVFKTNIINGRSILRFDGSNDTLSTSDLGLSQPDTVLLVGKQTSKSTPGRFLDAVINRQLLGLSTSGFFDCYAGSASLNDAVDHSGGFHILSMAFNGASSFGYVDGTQVVTGNPGSGGLGTTYLGSDSGSGVLNGDLAELIIYNSLLSTTNRQNVERYLSTRYGVSIGGTGCLDKFSSIQPGFLNTVSGGDLDPFTQNNKISYTIQAADTLSAGTYYWRVRAKDPLGSGTWGSWSATRSFTVSFGNFKSFTATLSTSGALTKKLIDSGFTANLSFVGLLNRKLSKALTAALSFNGTVLPPFLDQIRCSSTLFSGVGTRAVMFDLDRAGVLNSTPIYEEMTRTISTSGVTQWTAAWMFAAHNMGIAASPPTVIDVVYIADQGFNVAQFRVASTGSFINAHGQKLDTTSTFGTWVAVSQDKAYWVCLRHKSNVAEVMVLDGLTGAFVGVSKCESASGADLAYFTIHDYLTFNGGRFLLDNFVLGFSSNAAFPLAVPNFVLPPPTSVTAAQTGGTEVTLTWAGNAADGANTSAFNFLIERKVSGTWSTLSTIDGTLLHYLDSTVTAGQTYRYRVTAIVNEWSSTAVESSDVTISSGAWYDSVDPAITDTSGDNVDSGYYKSVIVSLPTGTVTKLRVYIQDCVFDATGFKIALYDMSGSDAANISQGDTSGVVNIADGGAWKEFTLGTGISVSSGNYRVAWTAQASPSDMHFRYKNGTGNTRLSDMTAHGGYTGFPYSPLTDPYSFSVGGSEAAGAFVI